MLAAEEWEAQTWASRGMDKAVFAHSRPCGRRTKAGKPCQRFAPRFFAACNSHISDDEERAGNLAFFAHAVGAVEAFRLMRDAYGIRDIDEHYIHNVLKTLQARSARSRSRNTRKGDTR